MTEALFERVGDLLDSLDRPGDYYAHGSRACPMPGIQVEGVGQIAFPLLPSQAEELIQLADAAPYGRGPETIVDSDVRRAWQIDAARLRFVDEAWPETLASVVADVARQLGVAGAVRAELYKLLLYERGGFFASHRDTEKADGMFGTLVVSLPSSYRGGTLEVRHQGRDVHLDLRCADISEISYAAFYADCEHELKPIDDGHRICLVYNLVRDEGPIHAPDNTAAIDRAERLLRKWSGSRRSPAKLLCLLDHRYSSAGLSFDALKGGDVAIASTLVTAGRRAECAVRLGMISIHEQGTAEAIFGGGYRRRGWSSDRQEDYEVIDVTHQRREVADWRSPDDRRVDLPPIGFDADELCRYTLDELPPDEQCFSEATGNEGASFERTYRRAAIVLWPRSRQSEVLARAERRYCLDALSTWPATAARSYARHVIDYWSMDSISGYDHDGVDAGSLLRILAGLGDAALAARFLSEMNRIGPYGAACNDGILACWRRLDQRLLLPAVSVFLTRAMRRDVPACIELAEKLIDEDTSEDPTCQLLAEFIGLLEPHASWWRWQLTPELLARALRVVCSAGNSELVERAVEHTLIAASSRVDEIIVPTLLHLDTTHVERLRPLRDAAVAHLRARTGSRPRAPGDLSRPTPLPCRCNHCKSFHAFLVSPIQSRWELKAAERLRNHVRFHYGDSDVDYYLERGGRPYTLVAVKNQRSHEHRLSQHERDLSALDQLDSDRPATG